MCRSDHTPLSPSGVAHLFVQQAYVLGKVFHHAPVPLRPVRDFILNRTPFLQKVVGERSPGEIIAQLKLVDDDEAASRPSGA